MSQEQPQPQAGVVIKKKATPKKKIPLNPTPDFVSSLNPNLINYVQENFPEDAKRIRNLETSLAASGKVVKELLTTTQSHFKNNEKMLTNVQTLVNNIRWSGNLQPTASNPSSASSSSLPEKEKKKRKRKTPVSTPKNKKKKKVQPETVVFSMPPIVLTPIEKEPSTKMKKKTTKISLIPTENNFDSFNANHSNSEIMSSA